MMTGNPYWDAILTGGISTIAGLLTKKIVTPTPPKLVREFNRTGGLSWDEAIQNMKDFVEEGWIPVGPPVRSEEPWGRDLCPHCFYETTDQQQLIHDVELRNRCPECNRRRLLHWRETWVFFTVELYRDVPEESL